jgi:hypothetical protein
MGASNAIRKRGIINKQELTQKQEAFCQAIATGLNMSDAYRSAYTSQNMSKPSINVRAYELMHNGKVTARIAELKKPALAAAAMTVESHLAELQRLRDLAVAADQFGPAVKAEQLRGAVAGYYITKIEATGTYFSKLAPSDKTELQTLLLSELERRSRVAQIPAPDIEDVAEKA